MTRGIKNCKLFSCIISEENITKYNKVIDEFNEALDFKFKHMNKILKELENK